jgi:hypothetical protein
MGVFMFVGFMSAFLVDAPTSEVPEVFAAATCQPANTPCPAPDTTKTSYMRVYHESLSSSTTKVQPDDGESWLITAYWNTAPPGPCSEHSETASVEVSWNGSAWELSNETTTTNIVDIGLCDTGDDCYQGETKRSWGYALIVDITDPVVDGGNYYNLNRVLYEMDTVDNGYLLNPTTCVLGSSVSWADTFDGGYDYGPFTYCPFDCEPTSPSLTLKYQ